MFNDLKQKEIAKKEVKPSENKMNLIKKELDFQKNVVNSFGLTGKENTIFQSRQMFWMFIMLVLTGGISFWGFINYPYTTAQIQQAIDVLWQGMLTLAAIFILIWLVILDIHKRVLLGNNRKFETIIKIEIGKNYVLVDKNKENWNIEIRALSVKSVINSEEYKSFIHSKYRKFKYDISKISSTTEMYCIEHIDIKYYENMVKLKENKEDEKSNQTN